MSFSNDLLTSRGVMKTHLFRPNELVTMCGKQLKHNSTKQPMDVNCRICLASYFANVDWYWYMQGLTTPPGARWASVDIPIPGLVLPVVVRRSLYL